MSKELRRLKKFIFLSNKYYKKLLDGEKFEDIVNQLDYDALVYKYSKDSDFSDLKSFSHFKSDSDIEDNFYALAKAYIDYYNTKETNMEIMKSYIYEILSR